MYDWLGSFISNRSQMFAISGINSEKRSIVHGVPQGSVLGPLLFLLYINSIYYQTFFGSIFSFADDMAFCYKNSNNDSMVGELDMDIKLLRKWFDAHHLILSDKTKVMNFSLTNQRSIIFNLIYHSQNCINNSCSSNCIKIEQVYNYKYLGLNFDSKLNWKSHVGELKRFCWLFIKKLYYIKHICPPNLLRIIYFSLFASKLEYGLFAWGGTYFSTIKPILTAQKHIVRLLCNKTRLVSSWPLFLSKNILPLRHMYIYKVLRLFFNRSGNQNLHIYESHDSRSNGQNFVMIPRYNTTFFLKSFFVMAPTFLNKLPLNIRILTNRNKFLSELKKLLFTFSNSNIESFY